MNEFMDFHLVVADKSLYRNCRGFAGCELPHCTSTPKHHYFGLRDVLKFLFCNQRTG